MCLRVCVRVCVCVCILILHSVNMYCCCTYLGLLHLDRFGECDDHAVYCPSLSALYYLNKFKLLLCLECCVGGVGPDCRAKDVMLRLMCIGCHA